MPRDTQPTYTNVKYGPHKHERNAMNVWLAESDKPAPVLFMFHPGGFRQRPLSKTTHAGVDVRRRALAAGISVVAPTYRHAVPLHFHDAARALIAVYPQQSPGMEPGQTAVCLLWQFIRRLSVAVAGVS